MAIRITSLGRGTIAALCLVGAALSDVPARANFYTGDELFRDCTASKANRNFGLMKARCLGYIVGAADALESGNRSLCLPGDLTVAEVFDAVIEHLRDDPKERRLPAWVGIDNALMEEFPCE